MLPTQDRPLVSNYLTLYNMIIAKDQFQKMYKERYKIEAKNAKLKQAYGYDRAISYL
jgi:hypothetical protein